MYILSSTSSLSLKVKRGSCEHHFLSHWYDPAKEISLILSTFQIAIGLVDCVARSLILRAFKQVRKRRKSNYAKKTHLTPLSDNNKSNQLNAKGSSETQIVNLHSPKSKVIL